MKRFTPSVLSWFWYEHFSWGRERDIKLVEWIDNQTLHEMDLTSFFPHFTWFDFRALLVAWKAVSFSKAPSRNGRHRLLNRNMTGVLAERSTVHYTSYHKTLNISRHCEFWWRHDLISNKSIQYTTNPKVDKLKGVLLNWTHGGFSPGSLLPSSKDFKQMHLRNAPVTWH